MGKIVRFTLFGVLALVLLLAVGLWIADKRMAWIDGLVESTPLTDDGLKVGARSREVMEDHGERFEFEIVITEPNPPGLLGVRIASEFFDSRVRYELRDRGGVTNLSYFGDTQFGGFLFRLMEPVVAASAEAKIAADLETLKRLVVSAPLTSSRNEDEQGAL